MAPEIDYTEADELFAASADVVRTPEENAEYAARAEEDFEAEAAAHFAEVYSLFVRG